MHELTQRIDGELGFGCLLARGRGPVRVRPRARDAHGHRVGMPDHELGLASTNDFQTLPLERVVPAVYQHVVRSPCGRGVLLSL